MFLKLTSSLLLFFVLFSCLVEMHQSVDEKSCADSFGPSYRCVSAVACAKVSRDAKFVTSTCGPNDEVCCPVFHIQSPPKGGIRRPYMRKRSTQDSYEKTNLKDRRRINIEPREEFMNPNIFAYTIFVNKIKYTESSNVNTATYPLPLTTSDLTINEKLDDPLVTTSTELNTDQMTTFKPDTTQDLDVSNLDRSKTNSLSVTMPRDTSGPLKNVTLFSDQSYSQFSELSSTLNTKINSNSSSKTGLTTVIQFKENENVTTLTNLDFVSLNNSAAGYQKSLGTINAEDLTPSTNTTPPDILVSTSPLDTLSSSSYTHKTISNVFDNITLLYLPYTRKHYTKVVKDNTSIKINHPMLSQFYHSQNSMVDLLKYTTRELLSSPNTPLGNENKLKNFDFRKKQNKNPSESETSSPETNTKFFNKTTSLKNTTEIFAKAIRRETPEQNKEYNGSSSVFVSERAILSTTSATEKIKRISTTAMPLIKVIPLTNAIPLTKEIPLTNAMPLIPYSNFKFQNYDEFEECSNTSALVTEIKPKVMLQTTPIPTSSIPRSIIKMKIYPAKQIQDKINAQDNFTFSPHPFSSKKSKYKDIKNMRDKLFRRGRLIISHLTENCNVYDRALDHPIYDSEDLDILESRGIFAEETAHFRSETGKGRHSSDRIHPTVPTLHDVFLKYNNPAYLYGLGLKHDNS